MEMPAGFEIDDDPERIDRDVVWTVLSTEVYWDLWRERSHVEAQLDSAWRLVGAYEVTTGRQVGFARAISDGVSFAYLADLVVTADARGCGLGKALVAAMIEDGPGAEFEWLLHTKDAHTLYERFGFRIPGRTVMERGSPREPDYEAVPRADSARR
ncbi:acetyltransferase (GNAT) family protein [Frankia sp. EI5c]|uniref:GNAT family N-acetyltransferase n=1 Tax=Frankia sp. EI5c TaxID=683316 RepID=UPI0007C3BD34|nr:GNAT family N-acetyltransferase [Frankia sp. EI5c]OAA23653.1 acetyltransferase (GNAT) family protein [Frankia sp. EI5c]